MRASVGTCLTYLSDLNDKLAICRNPIPCATWGPKYVASSNPQAHFTTVGSLPPLGGVTVIECLRALRTINCFKFPNSHAPPKSLVRRVRVALPSSQDVMNPSEPSPPNHLMTLTALLQHRNDCHDTSQSYGSLYCVTSTRRLGNG